MKTNCHPIIERSCERIRRHSTEIREAQKVLRESIEAVIKAQRALCRAVKAAVEERVTSEELYV